MGHGDLRVVRGGAEPAEVPEDPGVFQQSCVDAFVASWSARGFSPVFIENATGVLDRFLALLVVPAWEATPEHIDGVLAVLTAKGIGASTRRGYV